MKKCFVFWCAANIRASQGRYRGYKLLLVCSGKRDTKERAFVRTVVHSFVLKYLTSQQHVTLQPQTSCCTHWLCKNRMHLYNKRQYKCFRFAQYVQKCTKKNTKKLGQAATQNAFKAAALPRAASCWSLGHSECTDLKSEFTWLKSRGGGRSRRYFYSKLKYDNVKVLHYKQTSCIQNPTKVKAHVGWITD